MTFAPNFLQETISKSSLVAAHNSTQYYVTLRPWYLTAHSIIGLLDPNDLILKLYLLSYIYPPNSLPIYGLAHLNLRSFFR